MRLRMLAMLTALVVVSGACGNSKSQSESSTTAKAGTTQTTFDATQLKKHVPVTAKGVSDTEISVDTISSKTNPLHGRYAEIAAAMQPYFNMVNSEGGIYGRK